MVNEHSFILNHSPQDGKIFRRGGKRLAKGLSLTLLDVFTGGILAGLERNSRGFSRTCRDAASGAFSAVPRGAECGTFRQWL
jgi:hypothetical protein